MKKILIAALALATLCSCAPKTPETPYSNKLESIRKNLSKGGDYFVYFCDTHTDKEESCVTPEVLDEILTKVPVEKVIFGGDFCMTLNRCANKEDLDRSVVNFRKNVAVAKDHGCAFYAVRGNHDITTGTINPEHEGYTYSQAYVHETIMGFSEGDSFVESEDLSCNYYVDCPENSLRYIILDPYSSPEEDVVARYRIKMEFAGTSRD
ncbi:MAG: hypothetical protein MJY56_04865, partial [Bacteroidales bacterium]|nr:hypothetical protein [Bacteroidales bacterium]